MYFASNHSGRMRVMNKKNLYWLGLLFLGVLGLYFLIRIPIQNNRLRKTEPYQETVKHVLNDEGVANLMGSPVEIGRIVSGGFRANVLNGSAYLKIPIDGVKRRGMVYTFAKKDEGEWNYNLSVLLTPTCGNQRRTNPDNMQRVSFDIDDFSADDIYSLSGLETARFLRAGKRVVYTERQQLRIVVQAIEARPGDYVSEGFCD